MNDGETPKPQEWQHPAEQPSTGIGPGLGNRRPTRTNSPAGVPDRHSCSKTMSRSGGGSSPTSARKKSRKVQKKRGTKR